MLYDMLISKRKQLIVFASLIVCYAVLAFYTYLNIPFDQLSPHQIPDEASTISLWQMGFFAATIILIVYGLLGLMGFWFSLKLELPGIYREGSGWTTWLLKPLLLGVGVGILIVILDLIFAASGTSLEKAHPTFPLSLIASASAGIGEEILFRAFILGLWAFLINLLLRRWGLFRISLWAANIIGALAFSAAHIPAVMIILGITNPADISTFILVELLLLNVTLSLVAGEQYIRNGLVAAVGVHFWADIVWHVIYPLLRG